MQENITETVTQTIWGAIKSFLDLGFTLGSGNQEVRITVWTLLLVILSFVVARLFLKWIRVLLTRNMQEPDKLKFISFFKFVQYITYIIVGFAVL
ncbi:mechanosensitive ion channel protein MscS, partial [bacterium]|nr:mechanosensitive ion channel protein MscS [bacterium]